MILELLLAFIMFWRALSPLPNNTVDFIPGPPPSTGDTVAILFFVFKSPNMVAISGLTCDVPDASGKSDICELERERNVFISYGFNKRVLIYS